MTIINVLFINFPGNVVYELKFSQVNFNFQTVQDFQYAKKLIKEQFFDLIIAPNFITSRFSSLSLQDKFMVALKKSVARINKSSHVYVCKEEATGQCFAEKQIISKFSTTESYNVVKAPNMQALFLEIIKQKAEELRHSQLNEVVGLRANSPSLDFLDYSNINLSLSPQSITPLYKVSPYIKSEPNYPMPNHMLSADEELFNNPSVSKLVLSENRLTFFRPAANITMPRRESLSMQDIEDLNSFLSNFNYKPKIPKVSNFLAEEKSSKMACCMIM